MKADLVAILESLRHGQMVRIDRDLVGEVVFSSFSRSYAPDFPESAWPADRYDGVMIRLASGVLVFNDRIGFLHRDADIEVLR